jgi:hypothetical protein
MHIGAKAPCPKFKSFTLVKGAEVVVYNLFVCNMFSRVREDK